jgi:phosphohistidine phosphatase
MLLYLVQHAEASPASEDPTKDLSPKGRLDIEDVAHHLMRLNVKVNQIFHSGKTRAQTTARILGLHLHPPGGINTADGLAPLDDPAIWNNRIGQMDEDILLVGHLPHLGKLAGLLIAGAQERTVVNFKMGGAVRVQRMAADQWAVDWMIPPEVIL